MMTEVQERGQFHQFDNSQMVSFIICKLMARDLDKFVSLREENNGEGRQVKRFEGRVVRQGERNS